MVEFDERVYGADRYRIQQVGEAPSWKISDDGTRLLVIPISRYLWPKLVSGLYVDFTREGLCALIASDGDEGEFIRALGQLLVHPSLQIQAEIDGEWVDVSLAMMASRSSAKPAALTKSNVGRPRVSAGDTLAVRAHQMRHDGKDNEEVARELYKDKIENKDLSLKEARRRASDEASLGKRVCPDCRIN